MTLLGYGLYVAYVGRPRALSARRPLVVRGAAACVAHVRMSPVRVRRAPRVERDEEIFQSALFWRVF